MKMREGVKRKKGKMGEFWFVCGEKVLRRSRIIKKKFLTL